MGGKHKKFIRSEKAKVKLKGNKLPKGLNITKTEFKIKKIVIKEQLKEVDFIDGRKKHNVKDVLSRLRHHNSSFRNEALRNLKELLSTNIDEVYRELGSLVQGISMLCLDTDRDIRRESYKVLCIFFSTFNSTIIEPFFHIISSYLRCAMTHLQQSIQEDSLLLLDVLLIYLPQLVAVNSDKIFTNFLEMISKLRTDSKPGRTLTVNIGHKTTTTKWRSRILDRLQKMLHLMIEDMKSTSPSTSNSTTHYFNETVPQYFTLIQSESIQNCDLSTVLNQSICNTEKISSDEEERIRKYITCLLPLLIETWSEVKPATNQNATFNTQLILTGDAAITLKIILEIIQDLWEMANIWEKKVNRINYLTQWFSKELIHEFTVNILCYFPFQQSENKQSNNKQKSKEMKRDFIKSGGQNCMKQNLNIIYIYTVLYGKQSFMDTKYTSETLEYLIKILSHLNQITLECAPSLEKVLQVILYTHAKEYVKANEIKMKCLLKLVINQYQKGSFNINSRESILEMLCNIVLSDKVRSCYSENDFQNFLPSLPIMLTKENISMHTLQTLSNLGKQGNKEFLSALEQVVYNIIDNISKIKISGCEHLFEGQKLIMNLIYWINFWSIEEQQLIIDEVNLKIQDKEIANYFNFILLKQ